MFELSSTFCFWNPVLDCDAERERDFVREGVPLLVVVCEGVREADGESEGVDVAEPVSEAETDRVAVALVVCDTVSLALPLSLGVWVRVRLGLSV